MIKVEESTIHVTRGDEGKIQFSCKDENGNDYEFSGGQKVILKVFNRKNYSDVILKKEVLIDEVCTSVTIPLNSEDTTIGDYINKPIKYNYEISIDDTNTVIGYDDAGPKEFILYPEGGDE